eukprot:367430-Rhodomonas_salina.6
MLLPAHVLPHCALLRGHLGVDGRYLPTPPTCAICLRRRYAVPGTDTTLSAYAADTRCPVLIQRYLPTPPIRGAWY